MERVFELGELEATSRVRQVGMKVGGTFPKQLGCRGDEENFEKSEYSRMLWSQACEGMISMLECI